MTPVQLDYILALFRRFFADRPRQTPTDWALRNVIFDEPDNRGPFTLSGRHFIREPIDCWGDPEITDITMVFGSQTGKTVCVMAGASYIIANESSRIFWVMPTQDTVRKFSRTRFMPQVRRSMNDLIPKGGQARHEFTTFQQTIGGSIVDMVWSNSPAALASVPARVVILDEVDKFNEGTEREADATNLAEQRTGNFANPKRVKASTPTLVSGPIWQSFLGTDMRRRWLPCPFCGKFITLIWSAKYTTFELTGNEAEVRWDKEAKRSGGWDLERVERSARFCCPHCAGHVQDAHKTLMDRNGEWRPSATANRASRGYHLSSLYSPSAERNVGKLAVKFIKAVNSLTGVQGFINGDLAEPYQAQDTMSERIELVTSRAEVTAEWRPLMQVDCQAKRPSFWYSVRGWNGGTSEGWQAGSADSWDDLRVIQTNHSIPDVCVGVDSGFGAKEDAEVYRECVRRSEIASMEDGKSIAIGWMPTKGMPGRKRWKDHDSGLLIPYYLAPIDPFLGTAYAGQVMVNLLEFSADFFKDILRSLRDGKGGHKWSVIKEVGTDEYWRHMDAEVKKPIVKRNGFIVHEWQPRSQHWPNHLFDCEVGQVVLAVFHQLFTLPAE